MERVKSGVKSGESEEWRECRVERVTSGESGASKKGGDRRRKRNQPSTQSRFLKELINCS